MKTFAFENFHNDKLAYLDFWNGRHWEGWIVPEGTTWAQFRRVVLSNDTTTLL